MRRRQIVYIVSDINKALAFEWLAERLQRTYDLYFILIGKKDSALAQFLSGEGLPYSTFSDTSSFNYVTVWCKVFWKLIQLKPEVIHTHLWRANLVGLTSGWLLRIKKRVITRHHAVIHYNEHPEGRKWDKLCNFLATDIIAISENVRDILINRDKAEVAKIHLVHHGFDFRYFQDVPHQRTQRLREAYGISSGARPIVGVVARYTEWKGIQYAISAFSALLTTHPTAHLILANAHGGFHHEIRRELQLLPAGSYREITHEADLAALFRLFDIYIHVPVDKESEAFGQTYVEALAAGVPSIFTLSGVAPEFVKDRCNALVVPFRDSDAILAAMLELMSNAELAAQLTANGGQSIAPFDLEIMIDRLREIYG